MIIRLLELALIFGCLLFGGRAALRRLMAPRSPFTREMLAGLESRTQRSLVVEALGHRRKIFELIAKEPGRRDLLLEVDEALALFSRQIEIEERLETTLERHSRGRLLEERNEAEAQRARGESGADRSLAQLGELESLLTRLESRKQTVTEAARQLVRDLAAAELNLLELLSQSSSLESADVGRVRAQLHQATESVAREAQAEAEIDRFLHLAETSSETR